MLGEEQMGEKTRQYGRSADEIAHGWLALWEYANEALSLIRAFGSAEHDHSRAQIPT